jgi:hypothetical protein
MSSKIPSTARAGDVKTFLDRLSGVPAVKSSPERQHLIFSLDATASREPTWRSAQSIQGEMFDVASSLGGIEIQLCYYRGLDDFHATPWTADAAELRRAMRGVHCVGGYTQIGRLLAHVVHERKSRPIRAFLFVGDCVEEPVDELCHQAGLLALLGVRGFLFQEGHDPMAERAFRQIAGITGGAYSRFDAQSAAHLRDLLGAVAAYVSGGLKALEEYGRQRGDKVLQLTHQLQGR